VDENEEFEFRLRAEQEGKAATAGKDQKPLDPTEGTGTVQRLAEGFGQGLATVGRGIKQLSVMGPTTEEGRQRQQQVQADIDESRKLDAPLLATTAGKVGNVAGQVAASLPAAAIPGANTLLGGAAIGAGLGAAQPTATGESRGTNVLTGAAGGAAGQAVGSLAAKGVGALASRLGRPAATGTATAETEFLDQGYKIPPSMSKGKKPGMVTDYLEGFGGKPKTEQQFSAENAPIHTDLARKSIGLPPKGELTRGEVLEQREAFGDAYDAVKQFKGQFTSTEKYDAALDKIEKTGVKSGRAVLKNQQAADLVKDLRGDFSPDEAVEVVKKLRADSSLNLRAMDPNARALGRAQKRAAQAVDDLMEEHLATSNQKDIYISYLQGRAGIAKTYDVEKALTGGNQVSAVKLKKLDDAKRGRMSGELKTIAQFARDYEGAARDVSQRGSRPGPSISPIDTGVAAISAAAGHGAPLAKRLLMSAPHLARPAARKFLLSEAVQQGLRPGIPPTLEQQALPRAGELIGSQAVQGQQQ
jgi:hypothetical protein